MNPFKHIIPALPALAAVLAGALSTLPRPAQANAPGVFVAAAGVPTASKLPNTTCAATSTAAAPTVLELYTSEGCSSCPPADRWLSRLKGRSDVLALAFHVSYWDRLGWPDRFALPAGTARQRQLAQHAGSTQVYTPQVVANGKDWPQWHKEALPRRNNPPDGPAVHVRLQRQGDQVTATVASSSEAQAATRAARLSGYWAVLEDQHISKVRSGENAGETLLHDHVVRQYQPVTAWLASAGHQTAFTVNSNTPGHPQRVVFVLTDATTLRPLQAVALSC